MRHLLRERTDAVESIISGGSNTLGGGSEQGVGCARVFGCEAFGQQTQTQSYNGRPRLMTSADDPSLLIIGASFIT